MAIASAIWFYGAVSIAVLLLPVRRSLALVGLGILWVLAVLPLHIPID
ncbi:hypothetical protein [uncultured Parasphingorhabdus sp.]